MLLRKVRTGMKVPSSPRFQMFISLDRVTESRFERQNNLRAERAAWSCLRQSHIQKSSSLIFANDVPVASPDFYLTHISDALLLGYTESILIQAPLSARVPNHTRKDWNATAESRDTSHNTQLEMFSFSATMLRRGSFEIQSVHHGNRCLWQQDLTVRERLRTEIAEMSSQFPGFRPGLVVLQVGDRDDSNLYISMKLKAAAEIGINASHIRLPKTATEDEVLRCIIAANENPAVHGLIVQLPLDSFHPIDTENVTNAVAPEKDVDGLSSINAGKLSRGDLRNCYIPCTPNGCLELISQTGVAVSGKNAVVIGRSKIVGAPMYDLLLWNHATVTTCHSKTIDLAEQVGRADILVVGAGKAEMVKGEWVKEGAVVIDCGINHITDSSKPSGKRLVGDVHYPSAVQRAGYITPVPGGVGPMTVAMLMKTHRPGKWNIVYTKMKPGKPQQSGDTISCSHPAKPIAQLAREMGLFSEEVETYGSSRAKIQLGVLKRIENQPDGKYVVVTGITPPPVGEGKRTTAVGLAQALGAHLNINAFACVRETFPGFCFGAKGFAVGGGYCQVIPLDEVSLQPFGQHEVVSTASRLVMDAVKAHAHYETNLSQKKLGIEKSDPLTFTEAEIRCVLRLDIDKDTAADCDCLGNEIMAILSLSSAEEDLKQRLSRIVVATNKSGDPVTTEDLDVSGTLVMLLKDALKPVLMQTVEGTPVFVHTSPLDDIAQGYTSILADKMALKLVGSEGFVVSESGHGADVGLDKFFNIKCHYSGLKPDVVVMVANVRTLKMQGSALPNLKQLKKGCFHLKKQVENAKAFGLPVIVAVNTFRQWRLELLMQCSALTGLRGAHGALTLAEAVRRAAKLPGQFKFLYDSQIPADGKLRTVAKQMYGAKDIELSPKAMEKLALYTKQGFGNLPVFIAETHLSFSNDHKLRRVPSDFILPITDVEANAGAGFLCALTDSVSS
ncbi:C-1-tetrahydrofolate synthase, cytoplasmic [Triplophysa tibetana]|uniref:C-1-tetrahydrofolate synthase, cytoplasmic n=1 Tax=Triplophysa tibetana TaxID=1572043 RepID=A0A5A9NF20_9TELE|nr:C-1-tetrahydrofolate synthase, cytoplasmic [Triplophysa tibetana]